MLNITKEELAINIYKNCGKKELATNRLVEWWELAPNWKKYWLDIAEYVLDNFNKK